MPREDPQPGEGVPPVDATDSRADTVPGAPPAGSEPGPLPPGTLLGGGRYRILRALGHGGMSVVYQARDTTLGEDVALKFLLGSFSQSGFGEIREEVRLAHRIAHPNVCRVHDLEEIDGRFCIKMEHVAGRTLEEVLAAGPLTAREIVRVALGICAGLEAVHARGIVHRDLKPRNVVLEQGSGRVVLMDFGLARARIGGAHPIAGTPAYMSPEQAAGRPPDPRSDLYSLGVLLYELSARRRPFDDRTLDGLAHAHQHVEPPPLPGRVPRALRRVIARLLAKDPAARFASAAAVRRALEAPRRLLRRLPLAGAALALAGSLALGLVPRRPAPLGPSEWRPAVRALSTQEENLDRPAISPDGRTLAVPSTRGGSWDIWLVDVASARWTPLTADPEADETPEFVDGGRSVLFFSTRATRSGLWRVPIDAKGPPIFVTEAQRGPIAATREGREVLYARTGRDLSLLDLRTLKSSDVVHFPWQEGFTDIALAPDGKRALLGVRRSAEGGFFTLSRSDLYLVNLVSGEGKFLTTDSEFNCTATFLPGEPDAVVMSSRRGGTQNLWKLFLDGRPPVQITAGGGDDLYPIAAPDGRRLFYNHDNTVSQLWLRLPGRREWLRLTSDLFDHTSPSLDITGRRLVFATYDRESGQRRLWSAELPPARDLAAAGGPRYDARPLAAVPQVLEPALSPDGKELVVTSLHGAARALVLLGAEGSLIGTLDQGDSAPFCGGASLSADHALLAFARDLGQTGLYVSTRAGETTMLLHDVACDARFSPVRPRELAFLRRTSPGRGRLELIDIESHKARVLTELPFDATRLAWDPSGDALYVSDYEKREIRRLGRADGRVVEVIAAPGDNLVALAAGPAGLLVAEGSVGRTRLLSVENFERSPR